MTLDGEGSQDTCHGAPSGVAVRYSLGMPTHEDAARWTKAWTLTRWLQKHGHAAEKVAEWSDVQWELAAQEAGVKSPSEKTRAMVCGMLAGGERR